MLTDLFQNLREFAISKNGLETANSLIPSQSIVDLRESEQGCLVQSFQELLSFDDTLDFAAKGSNGNVKKDECKKGYPCGKACITATKNCRNPVEGQAANYAGFLELQAKQSGKVVDIKDKSGDTGKNKPVKQDGTDMKGKSEVTDLNSRRESKAAAEKRVKDSLFAAKLKKGDLDGAIDQAKLGSDSTSKIAKDGLKTLQDDQDKIDDLATKALKNIDEKLKGTSKKSEPTTETKKPQEQKLEPRSAKQQDDAYYGSGIPTDKQAKDRLASSLEYVKKLGYKPTEQELADLNSGDGRLFQKANDSIQENSYDIRAKKVADIRKDQKQVETQIDSLTTQRNQLQSEAKKISEANTQRIGKSVAKRVNAGLDADGGDGRSLNNPKVREQVSKLDNEARGLDSEITALIGKRNSMLVEARELGSDWMDSSNNPRNKKPQDTGKTEKPAANKTTEGRETSKSGYLLPIAGEEVFTRTAGVMGSSMWKAKVVKVNADGKTMMIEKSWEKTASGKPSRMTVNRAEWRLENDPQFEKEAKKLTEESDKARAESTKLKSDGIISANTAYENAVKSGEKPTEFKDIKKGDRFAQYIPTAGGNHVRLEYEYDGDGFGREIKADGTKGSSLSVGDSGKFTKVSASSKAASKDSKGYESKEITLATSNGKGQTVQAKVKGDIAIHQDDKTKGYTVTHIPSGGRVFKFDKSTMPGDSQKELKEKAEKLADSLQDLKISGSKLDAKQLTAIAEKLEAVRKNMSEDEAKKSVKEWQTTNEQNRKNLFGEVVAPKPAASKVGEERSPSAEKPARVYTAKELAPMSNVEKDKLFKPVLDRVNKTIEDHPAYKELKETIDRKTARDYDGKNGNQTKEKIAKKTPRDYLQDLVFDTKSAYGKKVETLQGQIRREADLPKLIITGSNMRNNSLNWDKIYLDSQTTKNFSEFTWTRENIDHYKALAESRKLGV